MKKKYLKVFSIVFMMMLFAFPAFSEDIAIETTIDNVDLTKYFPEFREKTEKNDQQVVENVVKQIYKNTNNHNLDGLKKIISDSFVTNDGFCKKDYLLILKKNWELWSGLNYKYEIKSITVNGNHAKVFLTSCGKMTDKGDGKSELKKMNMTAYSEEILHFQKYGTDWKLQAIYTIDETTIMAHGSARFMNIDLQTPTLVDEDTDYCPKLKVDAPDYLIPAASLDNVPVEFPILTSDVFFKIIEDDNTLERVVRSNSDNKNEHVIANVAFTHPKVKKNNEISAEITGLYVVAKRVNVINKKQSGGKL